MKFATLVGSISAAVVSIDTVFRVDRARPFDSYKSGHFLNTAPVQATTKLKAISAQDAFIINFECEGDSKNCELAKNTMKLATQKIALNLVIYNPIIINARFLDFCKDEVRETCPFNDVLGGARYASAFVIKKNEQFYMLNQAIVKQSKTNIKAPLSEVDIGLLVNSGRV